MKVTELENIPGLAIFTEFNIRHGALELPLFRALDIYNFGPCIQKWIRKFYTDCSRCFINNGFVSEFFKLERGTCPSRLSALRFSLCSMRAEVLPNAIRKDNCVKGIKAHDLRN